MITREEIKRLADQYEPLNPLYNATNPLVCPPNCQDKSPLPLPDSADYLHIQKQMIPLIKYIMLNTIAINIILTLRIESVAMVVARWKEIILERKVSVTSVPEVNLFELNLRAEVDHTVAAAVVQEELSYVGVTALSMLFSSSSVEKSQFCFHDLFGLNIRSRGYPVEETARYIEHLFLKNSDKDSREWGSLIEEECSKLLDANNNGLESEVVDSSFVSSVENLLSMAPQLHKRLLALTLSHYKEFVASSNFIRILNLNLSMHSSPFYLFKALLTVFHCCDGDKAGDVLSLAYKSGFSEQPLDLSHFKNVELEMGYLIEVGCMCTELTTTELDEYARSKQEALSNKLKERWIAQLKAKAKAKRQRQKLDLKQRTLDAQTLATTLALSASDFSTLESSVPDPPSSSIQPLPDPSTTLSSNSSTSESTNQLPLPSEPQENVIEEEVLVSLVADLDIESSDDENMPGLDDASDTDSE